MGDPPGRARRAETCARKCPIPTGEVVLSASPCKARFRVFERLDTFDTWTGRRRGRFPGGDAEYAANPSGGISDGRRRGALARWSAPACPQRGSVFVMRYWAGFAAVGGGEGGNARSQPSTAVSFQRERRWGAVALWLSAVLMRLAASRHVSPRFAASRRVSRPHRHSSASLCLPASPAPSALTCRSIFGSQVNVPKTKKAYCKGKQCKKHTVHKVTQYKTGKASLYAQGKRRYDKKQSGFGGQTKPVFHKKAKTTKKIVLNLQCQQCKTRHMHAIKRCKHFEIGGEKKTKGGLYG